MAYKQGNTTVITNNGALGSVDGNSLNLANNANLSSGGDGYFIEVQLVGGGGGQGSPQTSNRRRSGGCGGVKTMATEAEFGTTYAITVGSGGSAGGFGPNGGAGSSSKFAGRDFYAAPGGGGGGNTNVAPRGGVGGQANFGTTHATAGSWGSMGCVGNVSNNTNADGGGATGVGVNAGVTCIDGTVRAKGGNPYNSNSNAANTGNGGGSNNYGKAGDSGVVIIRYAGSQRGNGGTVSSSGGYTFHRFNSSGNFNAGNS